VYNKIYEIFIKQRPPAVFVRASPASRDDPPLASDEHFFSVATDAASRPLVSLRKRQATCFRSLTSRNDLMILEITAHCNVLDRSIIVILSLCLISPVGEKHRTKRRQIIDDRVTHDSLKPVLRSGDG